MRLLLCTLLLSTALAQEAVRLPDPVFGTAPLELGTTVPMGRRYTKRDFAASALPTTVRPLGRTQVMSNRPENVAHEGVLYRGTVNGLGSVYVYHVNAGAEPRRFAVALRNPGPEPVRVTRTALGTATVEGGYGYRYAGQEVAFEFLSRGEPHAFTLPPGGWRWLESKLPRTPVGYNGGVSLQADFETNGPVEVLVVSLDEGTEDITGLSDVPPATTGAGRGTFRGAERRVAVNLNLTDDREEGFMLSPDADWMDGRDEMTGEAAQNRGNYGVLYRVHVAAHNRTGEDKLVRLYAVNIGCVVSGAARLPDGRVFRLPEDFLRALDVNDHGTALGQIALRAGERGRFSFDFTPPGFSCLPVGVVARSHDPEEVP